MIDLAAPAGRMRGTGLLAVLKRASRGELGATLRASVGALPEPLREELDPGAPTFGITEDGWYSAPLVHALVDAVTAEIAPDDVAGLIRVAALDAIQSARELRPTWAMLESPDRVSRLLNAVWRGAFSDGSLSVVKSAPRRVQIMRTGWTGHHPAICRFGMEATRALYEMAGASAATLTLDACVSDGQAACRATVAW